MKHLAVKLTEKEVDALMALIDIANANVEDEGDYRGFDYKAIDRARQKLLGLPVEGDTEPVLGDKCPVCGGFGCSNCNINLACAEVARLTRELAEARHKLTDARQPGSATLILANLTPSDYKRFGDKPFNYTGSTGAGATDEQYPGGFAPYIATCFSQLPRAMETLGWPTVLLENNGMWIARKAPTAHRNAGSEKAYRVGNTLGTTIYNLGEDQPCAWVADNKALARKIVELLNRDAEADDEVI